MRTALQLSEPDLDTSVGSVARKILDAVAGSIASAYVSNLILTYSYDVDSKTGADLDAFVQLFGIARFQARAAYGAVLFSRTGDTTATVYIPIGTQITSADGSTSVQTVTGAVMMPGVSTLPVAVQALVPGPSGDVAAGVLVQIASPIQGVGAVANPAATTGGTAQESDSELRARWKATVFRSLAGTEAMYLGIALDDPDCGAANVIGAAKDRTEILQVPSSGNTVTQVADAAFVYSSPVNVTLSDGTVLVQGLDYQWLTTIPPALEGISGSYPAAGQLVTVSYQYVPTVSRNVPGSGITNRIDVWCGGVRALAAQVSVVFSNQFAFQSNSSSEDLYTGAWLRADQTRPLSGNVWIPLAYGPILQVPAQVTIGSTTYGLATPTNPIGTVAGGVTYAYQIVHEDTPFGWTSSSRFGLEWSQHYEPTAGAAFSLGVNGDYTYNQIPASVQSAVAKWRLLGTDVQVHQAKQRWLRFALGIVYDPSLGGVVTAVQGAINSALSDFLGRMQFNSTVQVSDVLSTVLAVPGVTNVRLLNGSDVTGYNPANPSASVVGIQQIAPNAAPTSAAIGSYVDPATGRAQDVAFADNELPVLGGIVFQTMAPNSFGIL